MILVAVQPAPEVLSAFKAPRSGGQVHVLELVEPLFLFGRQSGEGEFVDLTDAELDAACFSRHLSVFFTLYIVI